MNVKLSETELIDLITDILTQVKFNSGEDEVGFYRLDGESELGEQESGTSSAGEGTGTAAMTNWESGVARGVANQVGVTVNQSGYSALGRGKGNPLW
jgi:hypothetical protein|tara:strand:- start:1337 stop:1627 length:291 start_codon:yes stop_codon:yes gene_type:complete